jgi:hypothetical protein
MVTVCVSASSARRRASSIKPSVITKYRAAPMQSITDAATIAAALLKGVVAAGRAASPMKEAAT